MVTDYEKVKKLFNELGIVYKELIGVDKSLYIVCINDRLDRSNKIDGYIHFSTDFIFDKDGKFIVMKIYE